MAANLTLEFEQIKSLINQCNENEKIELVEILEKETFPNRFKSLIKSFRNNDINPEEIFNEVESVRDERYKRQ